MVEEGTSSSDEHPSCATEEETEMDPTSDNLYGKLEAQLSTKKTKKQMTKDDFAKHPTTTEQQSSVGKRQRRQNIKKKRNVNVTPNQVITDDRPQSASEFQCIEMIETMTTHIGLQEDRTPNPEILPEIPTRTHMSHTHPNTESVNV